MARNQMAVILYVVVSLNSGSRQIPYLGNNRRNGAGNDTGSEKGCIDMGKDFTLRPKYHSPLNGFLGAQDRGQLMPAQKHACTVGKGIAAPGA